MTAITAQLQVEAIEELIERHRVARMIAVGSTAFTTLIATVAILLAVVA
jgi:hypothetical protein